MTPDQIQQLQKIATGPTREEVEPILRSDVMRKYRIDIESDSTIRGDLTRNQQTMNLFLQGTAQFMAAVGPMIQIAPQAIGPAVEVYMAFGRQFKLGKSAEDALDKLAEAARHAGEMAGQPKPNPEVEAIQAKMAQDAQQHQEKLQHSDAQHQQKLEQNGQQFAQTQQQSAAQFEQGEQRAAREHQQKLVEMDKQHHLSMDQTERHHALTSVAEEDRHQRTMKQGEFQFEQKRQDDHTAHERNRATAHEDRHLDREDKKTERDANDRSSMIDHLSKGVAERESKGVPDLVKAHGEHSKQVAGAIGKLEEILTELSEELKAPTEIIKDDKGVAQAFKKGKRTIAVLRDHEGNALGLQ